MFNRKSIYALNKIDPNAIVCPDAGGNLIHLTRDDFASEEEFLYWKTWSDNDFHTEDKRDVAEDKHRVSLDGLTAEILAVPAMDVVMERNHDRTESQRKAADRVIQLKGKLTKKQFRRLWMYHVDRKSEAEIAEIEGVAQQQISKSIKAAEKRIKNFSAQSEKEGVKPPRKR